MLDLVGGVDALVAPQMHAKGIRVSYERCEPDVAVHADAEKVQQILLNLLTNAQKFTASGGRIGIMCTATGETVTITVSDTGRGIPENKLESIFEPFVQVDRHLISETSPNSPPDIGLGLAISRELARAMGGDIIARSEVGAGSVFTLVSPRGISTGDEASHKADGDRLAGRGDPASDARQQAVRPDTESPPDLPNS